MQTLLQCQRKFVLKRMLGFLTYSSGTSKVETIVPELRDLPEKEYYGEYYQKDKGKVYDNKPFKFLCKEGRAYLWCACGHSRTQPFCDNTHDIQQMKITLKPVKFICRETREYWFCNCKHTERRPFCDGSHNSAKVQAETPTVKPPR